MPPIIHVFPGQGDFSLSRLLKAVNKNPLVRDVFHEVFLQVDSAGKNLGLPPLTQALLSSDPPTGHELASRRDGSHQLALYGAQLTVHETLCQIGMKPDRVVGISFGELAAAVACKVLTVHDGAYGAGKLAQVLLRNPGALTVTPVSRDHTARVIARNALDAHVAGVIHHGSTIVASRSIEEIQRTEKLIPGSRRMNLPFGGHTPDLSHELEPLRDAWRPLLFCDSRLPFYSATFGRCYTEDDELDLKISSFLTEEMDIPRVLHAASEDTDKATWVECGTGDSATKAARNILPPAHETIAPLPYLTLWGD